MRTTITLRKASAAPALVAAALAVTVIRPAHADGPLGTYFGGTLGRGEVETQVQAFPIYLDGASGEFKESSTTLGVVLGIRPIRYLGAEIGYTDFGGPYGHVEGQQIHISMKAETAFGVLYLPVPVIDLYGKLGVARMDVHEANIGPKLLPVFSCPAFGCGVIPSVGPLSGSRTTTNFAFGAGAQYKFASLRGALGSLAARLEYDRFQFGGENPSQLAVGVTWTFF